MTPHAMHDTADRAPWRRPAAWLALGGGALALYAVTLLYAAGQTLIALALLLTAALAAWAYGSAKTQALRYLFPGVAAALVFVVLPMVYTVAAGFTNHGSKNLLDHDRVRADLLAETTRVAGPGYAFTLHGSAGAFRLRLQDLDDAARVFSSPPLALDTAAPQRVALAAGSDAGPALPVREVLARLPALRALTLAAPDGGALRLASAREFAPLVPRWQPQPDGSLRDAESGRVVRANFDAGFFESADGERLPPGFTVNVGFAHYERIFTDRSFSEPFFRIFVWTVVFAALSVLGSTALGLFLATLLSWEALRGRALFRFLLFLPYAVPGFISILIFKGLFNQNLGEVNLLLGSVFGVRPEWFSDPLLAKMMLLLVNVWLGFPYMMVLCMGLLKAIPGDLYEASAVAGAGPLTNFWRITMPLTLEPLVPLMISSFAFNFNNFVLVSLLTGGRPDFVGTALPAGETDILVSYTFRIAFLDSGQQFGLAAAISTVIFLIVAAITLVQMRFTRVAQDTRR